MNKYTLLETKYIDEISSEVKVYRHNKTNARVITISNDDDNKVFTIGFRTPPINNSGLTHILEHSVLCGSKKYPVKDPFVELIKSSLNTFLNAMTYPDKTVYPIASRNLKDFHNLMDVYLDAVFYPRIYDYKEIFMQEGWHYEILDKDSPIIYNGVVYNEMKGAFSDPNQVLINKIMEALYPDSPYGLVSGGDPSYIPDLSYEEFKEFHSKFYHPSNSYIYLYGDLDMDYELDYLDKEYLSKFNKIDFDTRIKEQKPFNAPKSFDYYYQAEDLNRKALLSYNVAFSNMTPKLLIATQILLDALFNTPGAPLKEALIKANIADDIDSMVDFELSQPMLVIAAINADETRMDEFKSIINDKLNEIINNGLDKKSILSLITYGEFKAREKPFSAGMPKGLDIILGSLSTYLYDDNNPYNALLSLNYYDELKKDLDNNYFENIIKNLILNNNHKAYVRLLPSLDCNILEEEKIKSKLEEYKKSLSDKELDSLIKMNIDLKKYQSETDTEEDLKCLPKLKREDISPVAEKYNLEIIDGDYKKLFSEYNTNDIGYFKFFFDISKIDINNAKYISLYTSLLFELNTNKHSYFEINQLIQELTGEMSSFIIPLKNSKTFDSSLKLVYSFSSLKNNYKKALDLLLEVINDTDFSDVVRIKEKLNEIKTNNDMKLQSSGHRTVVGAVKSLTDLTAYYSYNISGIAFSDFISDLINNFDNKKDEIINNLNNIKNLLSKKNFVYAFVGDKNYFDSTIDDINNIYNCLNDNLDYNKIQFKIENKNIGFKAPINVSYNALVGKYNMKFDGGMLALFNAISMEYLWFRVRVKGGSYGVYANVGSDGYISFSSYRDPNIKNTYDAYLDVINFVDSFNPNEEELLKYIIGAFGNINPVLHVKSKGNNAFNDYFTDYTYEDRINRRKELISLDLNKLKTYKNALKDVLNKYNIATLSSDKNIEDNKDLFTEIRNLKK